MIMLNLFIGVIINSMEEAHDEQAAEAREKSMEETGHLSVEDELVLVEEQLKTLQQQLRLIRTRGEAKH
jgi:hypothetical protein